MGGNRKRHQLAVGKGARARAGGLVVAALLAALLGIWALWGRLGTSQDGGRAGQDPTAGAEGDVGRWLGDDEAADLVGQTLGSSEHVSERSELPLADEAQRLLEGYERQGDCVVARAGYLDLVGRTWGCVIQGAGWVELCVVSEVGDGGSAVSVWRMDAGDVPRGP